VRRVFVPDHQTFPRRADVVVIGGGIVGVATAFWLAKEKLDVVLVEMRDGLSTLTTPASAECFRAQFTEPAMATLAKQSIEIFENFPEVIGIPGYNISLHQQGYLFMTDDPATEKDLEAAVKQHHQLGITDSEFLIGDEIRSRFPFVSPTVVAATFRQRDGWLSTHEVTQGFAKGSDASFLIQTKATQLFLDSKGICGVETTRGKIDTQVVVDTAGPFAGEVARMAGIDLPTRLVRRQKVFIAVSSAVPHYAPFPVDLVNGSYWRPEVGGALIAWVDPDEPVSEPSESVKVDLNFPVVALDKVMRLNPFWESIAPKIKKQNVNISGGHYVYTPDDQPLIGPVSEVPGFHLNCGYWAGVMLSPMAGKWVSDLITEKMDEKDNPLRLSRFEEGIVVKSGSFLKGH